MMLDRPRAPVNAQYSRAISGTERDRSGHAQRCP